MALISVQQLNVEERLSDLSLEIEAGSMHGIIGPNGSGKSTLLNTLCGLIPFQGDIQFDGIPLREIPARKRAQRIALLPQSAESTWALRVEDIVALGRLPWGDSNREVIEQAMSQAGIADLRARTIDHLSGGERARVWLARVLAGQPELLLVDEPIASLDLHYQCAVMDLLKSHAHQGQTVLIAIHDLSLAARYCDQLCLLNKGALVAQGTPSEVLQPEILSRVFAVDLQVDLDASPPIILPR